jgi:hypothetical protein
MTAFACSAPAESRPASQNTAQAGSTPGADARAAQPARPAPLEREAGTVVRVYPIADIVAVPTRSASDAVPGGHLFGGGGGGGGGAIYNPGAAGAGVDPNSAAASERASRIANFASKLQSIVAVDSWTDNGGLEGVIQVMDDSLLIRQTPANHKQIAELLASLRSAAVPIRIDVRWLSVPARVMDAVSEVQGSVRVLKKIDDEPLLNENPTAVVDRIELSAYSGDPLLATSGTRIPYVSDLEPVVGSGAVGFDPTISMIDAGASLRGSAYVLPGDEVRLDLVAGHVTLTEMATFSAGQDVAVIQTPRVADRTMAIRMTAPLGKPVVVGAVSASTGTTQPSDGKMIYLVITVDAAPAK